MKSFQKHLLAGAGMALVGTAAVAGAMVWTYKKAFRPQNAEERVERNLPQLSQVDLYRDKILANIDRLAAYEFEPVEITSRDGLRLAGRYYAGQEDAPLVIFFHGFRSTPMRDFSGLASLYLSRGLNLILVDQRAHGESEGSSITFGVKERHDCLSWANYAACRFGKGKKIILSGISMGAATVLMASDLDLPKTVVGIIADCPYSPPVDILLKVGGDLHFPEAPSRALLKTAAKRMAGFDLTESSAVSSVAKTTVPILLMHGDADDFVPADMSQKIADAAPAELVEFHRFPGAAHALSFLSAEERYLDLVDDFIARTTGYSAK